MTTLERLAAKLDEYPHIHYERTPDAISIEPEDASGFRLELRLDAESYVVSFDGWHEEFSSEDEAVSCFRLGLSEDSRLEVTYRGPLATKWVLQYKKGDEWVVDSITGLLIPPFWRKRVEYKQNHFLPPIKSSD